MQIISFLLCACIQGRLKNRGGAIAEWESAHFVCRRFSPCHLQLRGCEVTWVENTSTERLIGH